MMDGLLLASISALWLGILTSISPCPLATNIAAVTFVGNQVGSPARVFLSGMLYAIGRVVAYVGLGLILAASIESASNVSMFLQKYMNRILGPVLIVAGMIVLELIQLKTSGRGISERLKRKVETYGVWGAGLLGLVFALAFCPISAALLFGTFAPLSIEYRSSVLLPLLYGIGIGLPAIVFAVLIAFSARFVGIAFNRLTQFEMWARRVTGAVFIAIGIYFALKYSFRLF
jgi:cytochrome c biogenesis protein CcdA